MTKMAGSKRGLPSRDEQQGVLAALVSEETKRMEASMKRKKKRKKAGAEPAAYKANTFQWNDGKPKFVHHR